MNEIEKAIEDLRSYADASWGGLNDTFELALAALRAEEEREKGCVFCGEERHRIREIFDDGTARILCSMNRYALSVETPADATSESIFPIYFCPMCGRKLDGGGQEARKGEAE